jgi:hypothetical protein
MWHIGIDLHRRMLVMAAVKDDGQVIDPVRIACQDTAAILNAAEDRKPFRAMIQRRTKTDKLDAQLLANLLRIDQIPLAYVPKKGTSLIFACPSTHNQ